MTPYEDVAKLSVTLPVADADRVLGTAARRHGLRWEADDDLQMDPPDAVYLAAAHSRNCLIVADGRGRRLAAHIEISLHVLPGRRCEAPIVAMFADAKAELRPWVAGRANASLSASRLALEQEAAPGRR